MDIKQINELKAFLVEAAQSGYGVGESADIVRSEDQSYSIRFEQDKWKMHDEWFGGEPFGGRTVVFYEGKPFWIMVYYGEVRESAKDKKAVLDTLRIALKNPDPEFPYRGPERYQTKKHSYNNRWRGNTRKFDGTESIYERYIEDELPMFYSEGPTYEARYFGGLIDQREDE